MYSRMLANIAVSDQDAAEDWYSRLLDRAVDARPMAGLAEWHLAESFAVQTWLDSERAGYSTVVLEVSDLDAEMSRLNSVGIEHGGAQPGGGARILQISDPDGNTIVLAGS